MNLKRLDCVLIASPERACLAKRRVMLAGWNPKIQPAVFCNETAGFSNLGERGCFLAHYRAVKQAYEANCPLLFMFEDDVVFRNDAAQQFVDACGQLIGTNWDMLFLGGLVVDPQNNTRLSANLVRVQTIYHSHAYALTRKGQAKLVTELESWQTLGREPSWNYWFAHHPTLVKLLFSPILVVQAPGYSLIQHHRVDYLRGQLGSPEALADFRKNCKDLT